MIKHLYETLIKLDQLHYVVLHVRPSPFFFRLLSNACSDFGSVSQKKKKNAKIKLEKESGARRPSTSA